jgi:2,4-dienoyl-CoA reductase (NADPH2)
MEGTATTEVYPHLASPLDVGGRRLRNRFVQAPMSVAYAGLDGTVTPKMVEHYERRAAGGASMVITENLAISDHGRQLPHQALISHERFVDGLFALAAGIKRHGALAVAQIVHAGRYAGPWDEYHTRRRLAPSAVPFELRPGDVVTPHEMTADEIASVIEEFAAATTLARLAGFDGVEIHGAQGFLIASFQSPRMNRRTDAYGTERNLFAREVVEAVICAAGPDMIVGFHLMSDELMPGGWTLDHAEAFAATLKAAGVSFAIPVASTFESLRIVGPQRALGHDAEVTRRLAAAAGIPIFANGGLGAPDDAEAVLATGDAAAIALARPLFSDPDLPAKVLSGHSDERRICPCDPPMCLATQMTGSVCAHWPEAVRARGYWGLDDPPEEHDES